MRWPGDYPMRRLIVLAFLTSTGCTHLQLERFTTKQIATQTDIYYTEILNNLAMVAKYPGSLPPFTLLGTGQIQITDSGSNTDLVNPNSVMQGVVSTSYGVTISRADQLNWTIWPISDPDRLALMRCVYQLALGLSPSDCDSCYEKLRKLLCPESAGKTSGTPAHLSEDECLCCAIPHGWMNVGCKRDVPHHACYVGHYRDTYVWVTPDGLEGLTRLTLTILNLATISYTASLAGPPGPLPAPVPPPPAPSILKPRITPFILSPNVPAVPR